MEDSPITPRQLQYLTELYRLEQIYQNEQTYTAIADLAVQLLDTQSNATRILSYLRESNLVEHKRYQGIRTTALGKNKILKFLHRQYIIEAFLMKVMKFGWHEIHTEAQNLASSTTDKVLKQMWVMAGQPEFSPFGEPIPDKDGHSKTIDDIPLTIAEVQSEYRISRIMLRMSDRLEYLQALGLVPQQAITLLHRAPFDGPLQIKLNHEFRILGHQLAEYIFVIPEGNT